MPVTLSVTDQWRCYGWRNAFVFQPRKGEGDMAAMRAELDAFRARHPKFVMVSWILPGAKPPTPETRRDIDLHMKAMDDCLLASAVIIEGSGFFAGAFIAIASTMMRFRPGRYPMALTQSRAAAARWLRDNAHVDGDPSEAEILAALDAIHADFTAASTGGSAVQGAA